jgi:hypothetical protein
MANPSRLDKIQITGNSNSTIAAKVNVQEDNGEINTQTINTAFNKSFGLNSGDVVGATTLLNQYSSTPSDWTAKSYASGQVVFYGGKQWVSKESTVAGDVPSVSLKWEDITFEALANKTVTVDQTIIDGSTNAVSGNAVFDGLAGKFTTPTGLTTNYLPKWKGSGFGDSQIFDNGTNLGFGTTTPVEKFDVSGSVRITGQATDFGLGSAGLNIDRISATGLIRIFGVTGAGSAGDLSLGTNNSERIRLTVGGKLLVNTSTDDLTNQLQVNGTISASPAITSNQVPTKAQLDLKADLASPNLTGVPTAPTATLGTNTTQIATTSFVLANGARPYKVYTALLSQTGTNAPTATILENTTGQTVTLVRVNVGVYQIILTAPQSKTFVLSTPASNHIFQHISVAGGGTAVNISTASLVGSTITPTDGLLQMTPIEIRVYN